LEPATAVQVVPLRASPLLQEVRVVGGAATEEAFGPTTRAVRVVVPPKVPGAGVEIVTDGVRFETPRVIGIKVAPV